MKMNWKLLAIPGALVSFLTAWGMLGFPYLATDTDIKRLDSQQVNTAIEVFNNKIRSYLLLPQPEEPVQRQFLREELESARRHRDAAEQRKIELSK